jgi:uncharacterized membrane protein HdeD (DUF308 family)
MAIFWPGISLIILLTLFGVYAIADGIVSIISAFSAPEGRRHWLWFLLIGIVGIAAGIVAFSLPGVTTLALLTVIAVWAIVVGVLHVISAFSMPSEAGPRWLWGVSGAISVIFGILLLSYPAAGVLALVWLVGFYAIVFGFAMIVLGFELRDVTAQLRGALQH